MTQQRIFFSPPVCGSSRWLAEVTTQLKVFDYSVLEILFPQLEQEEKKTATTTAKHVPKQALFVFVSRRSRPRSRGEATNFSRSPLFGAADEGNPLRVKIGQR